MKHLFKIEVTDTFNGEANYLWVKRYNLELPENVSDLQLVRAAKKISGFNGIRCKREYYGDSIVLKPYRINIIMFIDYIEEMEN